MRRISVIRRTLWASTSLVLAIGMSGSLPLLTGTAAAAGLALDKQVSTHQSSGATSVTSPAFSTAQTNELLVAFVSSDGPSSGGSQSFSSVTGGSLTWTLRKRTNAQAGTAEIWTAVAASKLTNVTVKGTHSGSWQASITVATFTGADITTQGATAGGNAATGAPSVSLTTTRPGSWVWGVGNDWDQKIARTVGPNQTKVDEFLASVGDTFWVQRQTSVTPAAGTVVPINDTAPTTDRWNLSAIEILPAVVDTMPPSVPTNLAAVSPAPTQVSLSWTASTDDVGVAGYKVLRDGSQIGTTAGTIYSDTTAAASTTYTYTVRAYDGVGNTSADSNGATITTDAPDSTAPTVQMTTPADGAAITGTVTLAASASDNVGVAGVQFLLDNANVGAEVTTAPYSMSWDSATVANGAHTLSARARDAAGNTTTSTVANVTVSNTAAIAPSIDSSTPGPTAVPNNVLSAASPSFSPPANTVVYAVLSLDAAAGSGNVISSLTNSGTPLTWTLLGRENHTNGTTTGGDVEVWWAYNAGAQSAISVTANFNIPTKNVPAPVGDFQILVMKNAAANQSTAAVGVNWLIDSASNTPNATVTTTRANSKVFGVFDNWNYSAAPTPGAGQTIQSMVLNPTDVDGYWVQEKTTPVASALTPTTMNATLGGINEWHALAWEVLAAN